MNTTTSGTMLAGMTAAVGAAMVLSGMTGLPLLFGLAVVIAASAVTFVAAVILLALFGPARRPVTMRRTRAARAAA